MDAENKTSYLLLLNIRISIDEALVFNVNGKIYLPITNTNENNDKLPILTK